MLDPYQDSTTRASDFFQPLQAYLETSFPRTPEAFFEMEQRLYKTAARAGDDIVLRQIVAAHDDRDFVKHAVAEARATSAVPLLHTGWKETSVAAFGRQSHGAEDSLSAPGSSRETRPQAQEAWQKRTG